ncbi:MAG: hypothetical protein KJ065_06375 [Anaerolineae bacterium]|nr:hypothetical protein [Anaerolineae bacterium]
MKAIQTDNLDHVLAAIRERWGQRSVVRASDYVARSYLPTGYSALDQLLSGGIPRGRMTEFLGRPTSGKTTLAFSALAAAQRDGVIVVYLDVDNHSDPDYLTHLGVSHDDMLLVRSPLDASLALMRDVIGSRIPCLILLDLPEIVPPTDAERAREALRQMASLLTATETIILLLLSGKGLPTLAHQHAAVRLSFQRQTWTRKEGEITGCRTSVRVERNLGGLVGQTLTLDLVFPDSFAGGAV